MQKLQVELENIPKDAHQVLCSINPPLNKEEILSVADCLKNDELACNNPDGDLFQHTESSLKAIVYVQSKEGLPLMPCSQAKAVRMLKKGAAHVIKRTPFTIQLNFSCDNVVQEITLGVDTGYKTIGVSAVSQNKELISADIELRQDISNKLKERAMYRRGRRNKLWYRQSRWSNRANANTIGRLMPSVLHKVNTHIAVIDRIKKLLPISRLIIETGSFDMAKMVDAEIHNYQYAQGQMFGFENVKAYVLSRDGHSCYFKCKDSQRLHVHHIKYRSQGGTDNPDNLITLCRNCHEKVHAGNLKLNVKKHKELKSATVMNVIRNRILAYFPEAVETFGYLTKACRRNLGLDKSHVNDAFVIANGGNQERSSCFNVIQKRRNNRCLQINRKGFKPSIKRKRSKIQPLDLFWIRGKKYICKGMHSYGRYICYGQTKLKEYFKMDLVQRFYSQGNLVWN